MKTGPDLPGRSPDLFFLLNEHMDRLRENHLAGPADIVIEVTSPSTGPTDRGAKYYEYEAGGVTEYWLIDPQRRLAEFHRLGTDGQYAPAPVIDGVFESAVLPGLRFRVEWLWSRPMPAELA
jgi:Uma2 family endonuclease